MPQHFVTINCHSLDNQLFNDIYNFLIPLLKQRSQQMIWNVEYDNTPRQHLHILCQHDFRDGEKLGNHIKCKEFKNLLKNTNTILKNCLNIQVIDKKVGLNCWDYKIGYIFKETISKRSNFGNLSQMELNEKIDFYFSIARSTKSLHRSDVILITSKNLHTYYEMEQQLDESFDESNFVHKMIIKNYDFMNIQPRQLKLFADQKRYIKCYQGIYGNDSQGTPHPNPSPNEHKIETPEWQEIYFLANNCLEMPNYNPEKPLNPIIYYPPK